MTTHPDTTYPPLLVQGQTWEEMTVGSVFRTAARTITETDLVTFVTWSGFNEALFLDASHAAAGGYTGRLVPGALVYCLGEGLVIQTNVINGTGLAFMSMDLSVKQPAYVGDTIHVVVEVTEARAASTGQRGVVTTKNSVRNQRGEDVLIYTPVRLIRGRGYQLVFFLHAQRRLGLLSVIGRGADYQVCGGPGRVEEHLQNSPSPSMLVIGRTCTPG